MSLAGHFRRAPACARMGLTDLSVLLSLSEMPSQSAALEKGERDAGLQKAADDP
jgi:hypothetical protein